MTGESILAAIRHPVELLFDPTQRLSIFYLATALAFAIFIYWRERSARGQSGVKGLLNWLVPWDVVTHDSAKADYFMFFINKSIIAAIYASILIQAHFWVHIVEAVFGPAPAGPEQPSWGVTLIYTIAITLAFDGALWFGHYIFHKVPVLWEFHKVHHSAEVMTPLTAVRMHPFEEAVSSLMGAFAVGVTFGLLDQYFGSGAREFSLFQLNIIMFVFFVAAFNLRHSHVWLRYPNWLQHVVVSPAQHQVHHSKAIRHWDKNMGFIFAFWDWAAGTLYSPKTRETLDYGLGNGEDGTWNSPRALYFRPFKNAYALFKSGWRNVFVFPPKHMRPKESKRPEEAASPNDLPLVVSSDGGSGRFKTEDR